MSKLSVVICTYMRPESLERLLISIKEQTEYPEEILIIDGSTNTKTSELLENTTIENLTYYRVPPEHRGLTRQRNYGVERVSSSIDIISFLDDDTVLQENYIKNLKKGFEELPDAIGIGGVAINENRWKKNEANYKSSTSTYILEGYYIKESLRNKVRNVLKLSSPYPPSVMPPYSHGRTYMYPLTNKRYPVDLIVGMSMAFKKSIFDEIQFSKYFEGYGLYEDADFSIRAGNFGQLYVDTNVQLEHFHAPSGRPNQYKYGKMVTRNGWFIWRTKFPKPSFKNILKWYAISYVLIFIRFLNVITTKKRVEAFTESLGRVVGLFSLIFNKPKRI